MVDSRAMSLFLDRKYTVQHKMFQKPLEKPIIIYNIDGTLNKAGSITHYVNLILQVKGDKEKIFKFLITDLGPEIVILGLPWLRHRNPDIDWMNGTMKLAMSITEDEQELEVA